MQSAAEHTAFTWNYFSIGMDAKTVYSFDRLRENKPALTPGGNINKFWCAFGAALLAAMSTLRCCRRACMKQNSILRMFGTSVARQRAVVPHLDLHSVCI